MFFLFYRVSFVYVLLWIMLNFFEGNKSLWYDGYGM